MRKLVLAAIIAAFGSTSALAVDFSGPYIGVDGGYGSGSAPTLYTGFAGVLFGGHGGYNITTSNGIVFGVQIDGDWQKESGSIPTRTRHTTILARPTALSRHRMQPQTQHKLPLIGLAL